MSEVVAVYEVRVSGLWNTSHRFLLDGKELGVLRVARGRSGVIRGARYSPEMGEVLILRRDPGLLRGQFSLWTDGQEWLASSLRWSLVGREVVLHTGSKPLRLLPLPGLRFGWTLQAPRTGEMARVLALPLSRRARVEVSRKLDFELVVFSYFLGSLTAGESWWPGPRVPSESSPRAPARPGTLRPTPPAG